jgi:hypothetical protein
MVMWLLGGTGVFLLYSAYKNQKPQALLVTYVNGSGDAAPISTFGVTTPTTPAATPQGNIAKPGAGIDTFPAPKGLDTYGTRQDVSGTWNLLDSAGRFIGVVPQNYQRTPQLYIPAVTV